MRIRTARLFVAAMALAAIGCSETPPPPAPQPAAPAAAAAPGKKGGPTVKKPKLGNPTGPTELVD